MTFFAVSHLFFLNSFKLTRSRSLLYCTTCTFNTLQLYGLQLFINFPRRGRGRNVQGKRTIFVAQSLKVRVEASQTQIRIF